MYSLVVGDNVVEVLESLFAAGKGLKRFPCRIGVSFPMDKVVEAISLFPTVGDVVDFVDIWSLLGEWRRCLLAVYLMFF